MYIVFFLDIKAANDSVYKKNKKKITENETYTVKVLHLF